MILNLLSTIFLLTFFLPSIGFLIFARIYNKRLLKPELPIWLGFLIFPLFILSLSWNFGWLGIFEPLCRLNEGGQYGCLAWRLDLYATLLAQIFFSFWFHLFLILQKRFWILINSAAIFLILLIPTYFYSAFPWNSNSQFLSYLLILTGFVDIFFYFFYFRTCPKSLA
jgi:hypothetical protein